MSDEVQFKWLNEQIGGTVEGYTWHHTEIPGKMQLVPTGIHNITTVHGILDETEINPFRIKYYCENRDPDFDSKMHNVLLVYK